MEGSKSWGKAFPFHINIEAQKFRIQSFGSNHQNPYVSGLLAFLVSTNSRMRFRVEEPCKARSGFLHP